MDDRDLIAFAQDVLTVLRQADGEPIFGRVCDFDDSTVGHLVRRYAEDRQLHPFKRSAVTA